MPESKLSTFFSKQRMVALALFLFGAIVGWSVFFLTAGKEKQTCSSEFIFLNPELPCELSDEEESGRFNALELKIRKYVENATAGKTTRRVSVFFRDLNRKRWIGVNENKTYIPASLLKLPAAVAFLKLSEIDPGVLKQGLLFNGGNISEINAEIKPAVALEAGKVYGVDELLNNMLVYSDNDAMDLLVNFLDNHYISKVLVELGIYVPTETGAVIDYVSPKTYANIWRVLFNASYLNKANSEKLLEMASRSEFKDGLRRGVPESVAIAHKFAERTLEDKNNGIVLRQLHDCGIVYAPDNPYSLCVMTEGQDIEKSKKIIGDISALVYQDITH